MPAQLDQVIVSDTNLTPIVQIITWLCLVTSLLAFLTHAGIKIYVFRSLKVESWFVLISLVFCIAQSIAVIIQCAQGYGTPLATLSNDDIRSILKGDYAATLLLFISLGFSKLAIGAFIHNLTPSKLHHRINFGIGGVVCLWLVCSVFIAAFECSVPQTWNRLSGKCIDRYAWWTAVAVWNIITEIAIVALELGITARLHVARQRKAAVMSLFACRFLVLITASIQLYYFHLESRGPKSSDLTLGFWRSAILNQLLQCLAIVTTCLPYTKIFMEGFESGLMRLDDLRRRGEHTSQGKSYPSDRSRSNNKEYQLMDMNRSTGKSKGSRKGPCINVSKSWAVETEPATEEDHQRDTGSSESTRNLRSDRVEHATTVEGDSAHISHSAHGSHSLHRSVSQLH